NDDTPDTSVTNQTSPDKNGDTASVSEEKAQLSALPLEAQDEVLESGRSVATDPATGQYSMMHAVGDYTVRAEAYGFASDEEYVTVEKDGTATANFTLENYRKRPSAGQKRIKKPAIRLKVPLFYLKKTPILSRLKQMRMDISP